jgi:hypothetical protein
MRRARIYSWAADSSQSSLAHVFAARDSFRQAVPVIYYRGYACSCLGPTKDAEPVGILTGCETIVLFDARLHTSGRTCGICSIVF